MGFVRKKYHNVVTFGERLNTKLQTNMAGLIMSITMNKYHVEANSYIDFQMVRG